MVSELGQEIILNPINWLRIFVILVLWWNLYQIVVVLYLLRRIHRSPYPRTLLPVGETAVLYAVLGVLLVTLAISRVQLVVSNRPPSLLTFALPAICVALPYALTRQAYFYRSLLRRTPPGAGE